jgi:hypothetical protein
VAKFGNGCWSEPMADVDDCRCPMKESMSMMVYEDVGVAGRTMVVCRSPKIDRLLLSIIVKVYFMYGSCLVWN